MGITGLAEAARERGLEDPRVMPYRKRTGEVAYKLYYGPASERLSQVFSAGTPDEDVQTILARLSAG